MDENIDKFFNSLLQSLENGTFVKVTLANYKGSDKQLQKLFVRRIETRKGKRLELLFRYETRDISKNYEEREAAGLIRQKIGTEFRTAHLFTTSADLHLEISKKGKALLRSSKPEFTAAAPAAHDRQKKTEIDPQRPYLNALGITTRDGRIKDKQQGKWRQINKYVEILSAMFDNSPLKDSKMLKIVDMGSGKGYLTFAAYDHFRITRGIDAVVTGVEIRKDLVDLCSRIAEANGYEGLEFVQGSIGEYRPDGVDMLIALHACDTATDEALFMGIREKAGLIIAAPCCHKEIRRQISSPEVLQPVLEHGVMMERMAEMVTDGLRSLLLEREGYSTKIFEFVPVEHTPKNNMLVASRNESRPARQDAAAQIDSLMEFYGIETQRLLQLLSEPPVSR